MADEDDPLIPAAKLAERPGFPKEQTLATWRCMGKGPNYIKIGRAVFYRESAIKAFLKAMERQPKPAAERKFA